VPDDGHLVKGDAVLPLVGVEFFIDFLPPILNVALLLALGIVALGAVLVVAVVALQGILRGLVPECPLVSWLPIEVDVGGLDAVVPLADVGK